MNILEVKNVSKSYKSYGSEMKRLLNIFFPIFDVKKEFWALNKVNLQVKRGQSIGLVGINGAGKSTLLKIITGTLKPTSGQVYRNGKIAAILELGMGFNPNLTGRQNAINSAGLLGYSKREIQEVLPFIKEFSEIEDFFDQPVRIYSSGMQMRVAFAVATAFRPDLLIIDEALSVGDVSFQQKCIERIQRFKDEGTSLLFVTHDLAALHEVCEEALLIVDGRILNVGQTSSVVQEYFRFLNRAKSIKNDLVKKEQSNDGTYHSLSHFLSHIKFLNEEREEIQFLEEGQNVILRLEMKNLNLSADPHVGFRIQNRLGTVVYETNTFCQKKNLSNHLYDDGCINLEIKFLNTFSPGEYSISVGVESEGGMKGNFKKVLAITEKVSTFTVVNSPKFNQWAGISNIFPVVEIKGKDCV